MLLILLKKKEEVSDTQVFISYESNKIQYANNTSYRGK